MPERISSVYDIPDWLAEHFPGVTGSARAVGNAAMLPIDVGADLLRLGTYGALGLEEEGRGKFTAERLKNVQGALSDAGKPVEAARGGVTNALEGLREKLIAAGGKPTQALAPMDLSPGGMDAELQAAAPMPRTPAAARTAPMPRTPVPAPAAPMPGQAGAIEQAPAMRAPQPAGQQMPPAIANTGALEEPLPEAPRPSLMAQFKERMAAIPAVEGKMTEQEKKQRQLEFFLNMLARGSKGGATFLPSMAQAGLDTSAGVRADREKAQGRAAGSRKESREDVSREINFGDKDEDNRRGDAREARQIKALEKQIAQGKVSVQKDAAKGTYVILDTTTVKAKDTGIRFPKDSKGNAQVELIQYLEKLTPEQRARALEAIGRNEKDTDPKTIFDAAVRRVTSDQTGDTDIRTEVQRMREGLEAARGRPTVNSKPATQADAHRQAADAIKEGVHKDEVNKRLNGWGYEGIK